MRRLAPGLRYRCQGYTPSRKNDLDVSILSERNKGDLVATVEVKQRKDEDDGQKFMVHLSRTIICKDKKGREVSTLVQAKETGWRTEAPKNSRWPAHRPCSARSGACGQ